MNQKYKWLDELLGDGQKLTHINALNSYPLMLVDKTYWSKIFQVAASLKYRFSGLWAEDLGASFQITAGLEFLGEPFFVRTEVPTAHPDLVSIASYYPAANRLERHAHDMFGVTFVDHSDQRRWTRHKAWQENEFPLCKNFSAIPKNKITPPDVDYPFLKAQGIGVCEIPVGPVHAGIIEPGHFRFQVAGEDILNLEERLGYVHKGIEKIAEGRDVAGLIKLAGRVSGDSTVAYSWASSLAAENAFGLEVPERALFLRGIMAERERIANHLGDFGAICNDVGFAFAYYQFMRLKELWLRLNKEIFGHRFMMDKIIFGGAVNDLTYEHQTKILQQLVAFKKELEELYPMIEENSSLHDRLKSTGTLSHEMAHTLGALGYVGRASGCKLDLRRDLPYAPYDQLKVRVPIYNTGDVLARIRIRAQEILVSLELIEHLIAKLPSGPIVASCSYKGCAKKGIGLIESWRGEILVYVSFNNLGLVERYFPRDPSWFNWLALEHLIDGNIVPDFPVCNKSINGSYSGVDL